MVTSKPKPRITRRWIKGIKVKYCGKRLTKRTHTDKKSWYLYDEDGFDEIGSWSGGTRDAKWIVDYEEDYCGRAEHDWIVICRDCYQNAGFEW